MIKSLFNSKNVSSILYKQNRFLNLQEYQSKGLMNKYGVTIQKFKVASNLDEAKIIAKDFKVKQYVVKAQILAGGRGKGTFENGFKGGVHLTYESNDVPKLVSSMVGHKLVTKQTSKSGVLVNKVMIAQALDIVRETYLAYVLDRASDGLVIIASPRGGVDIEEVAKEDPNSILKVNVDIDKGLTAEQLSKLSQHLQFTSSDQQKDLKVQLEGLFNLFNSHDCTQIEINPLGETDTGKIVCFDAKLNFDDNAAYRQREIFQMFDPVAEQQDPKETKAQANGLTYIGLDGNIGCVVNGAGLAMATMDMVQMAGGKPANFLDLGGGVTVSQVEKAFEILQSDNQVQSIFVNIFGGIVNCATVANGLVTACKNVGLKVPLIVRLEGTNADEAKDILKKSNIKMQTSSDFEAAANMAVASIN